MFEAGGNFAQLTQNIAPLDVSPTPRQMHGWTLPARRPRERIFGGQSVTAWQERPSQQEPGPSP